MHHLQVNITFLQLHVFTWFINLGPSNLSNDTLVSIEMAPKIGTKSVNLFPDQALSNTLNMIINANKNASENNYESEDQFNAESAKLLMLTLSNLFSLQNETTCE